MSYPQMTLMVQMLSYNMASLRARRGRSSPSGQVARRVMMDRFARDGLAMTGSLGREYPSVTSASSAVVSDGDADTRYVTVDAPVRGPLSTGKGRLLPWLRSARYALVLHRRCPAATRSGTFKEGQDGQWIRFGAPFDILSQRGAGTSVPALHFGVGQPAHGSR